MVWILGVCSSLDGIDVYICGVDFAEVMWFKLLFDVWKRVCEYDICYTCFFFLVS